MKALNKVLVPVLTILLAACSPKSVTLTQENLDRVHEGMSSAQVKAILGVPTDSKDEPIPIVGGTKTTYTYSTDGTQIIVILKNDTVQSKEGHFPTKQ